MALLAGQSTRLGGGLRWHQRKPLTVGAAGTHLACTIWASKQGLAGLSQSHARSIQMAALRWTIHQRLLANLRCLITAHAGHAHTCSAMSLILLSV